MAGKKERESARDRARALRLKTDKAPKGKEESESAKFQKGLERQKALEDGTYFQGGGGAHKTDKSYKRRPKHNKGQDKEASDAAMEASAIRVASLYLEGKL